MFSESMPVGSPLSGSTWLSPSAAIDLGDDLGFDLVIDPTEVFLSWFSLVEVVYLWKRCG